MCLRSDIKCLCDGTLINFYQLIKLLYLLHILWGSQFWSTSQPHITSTCIKNSVKQPLNVLNELNSYGLRITFFWSQTLVGFTQYRLLKAQNNLVDQYSFVRCLGALIPFELNLILILFLMYTGYVNLSIHGKVITSYSLTIGMVTCQTVRCVLGKKI